MTRLEYCFVRLSAIIACLAICASSLADDDDEIVPGQVIVKLVQGAQITEFVERYAQYQVELLESIASRRTFLLGVPEGDEEEFVDIIIHDPDVDRAEPCYTGQDVNPDPGTQSIFVASTRSAYLTQYAVGLTRMDQAQNYSRGQGVIVAVLDSGLDRHHFALAPVIAPGGWNFIDNNADISDVGDGIDNDGDDLIDEAVGHGTMVAGLIRRTAPAARILPLKVLDSDGFTTTFRMVEAMYYAIDRGVPIINMSLGTTQETFVIEEAVLEALAARTLIIACTGNEDTASPVRYPSALSHLGVVAVSATDRFDRRADFSNFGEHVSICAPGEAITSTVPGNRFGRARGTSFAAPMVTGTAAILLSARPQSSPEEIRRRLYLGARDIRDRNPGYEGFLGAGRLDALVALRMR